MNLSATEKAAIIQGKANQLARQKFEAELNKLLLSSTGEFGEAASLDSKIKNLDTMITVLDGELETLLKG